MMRGNHVNGKIKVLLTRNLQKQSRVVLAFIAAVLLLSGAQSLAVSAADTTANTLRVTPVRSDIEINPGERKTVPVTVTNVTNGPILVRPIANDFVAGDERGTPGLILDDKEYAPTHSLKRFMSPFKDVTIPAKETRVVDVVITVPKTAQAGGYFGAVRFAPTDPDGGGQVNLSASVASIILLTVPGEMVEKLNLTDFEIKQDGRSSWYFTKGQGIQAAFRLENKGSAQMGPFGRISVKKGDKVVYDYDFNSEEPRDMVLPNSARRWDVPLDKIDGFGRYTVSATLSYGKKNQTIEVSETFWIITPTAMIVGGVALVALLLLILALWLFIRSRKKRSSFNKGLGSTQFRR